MLEIIGGFHNYSLSKETTPYTATLVQGLDGFGPRDLVIPAVVTDGIDDYIATAVGSDAFGWTEFSITLVSMPNTIKVIGSTAFYYVSINETLTLSKGLEEIGGSAFQSQSFGDLIIPYGVKKIGINAFWDCSATTVKFENPNGWWYANSSTATSGTPITEITAEASSTTATLLMGTYYDKYWFRTDD